MTLDLLYAPARPSSDTILLGIGRGLVQSYPLRPSTTVIAAVRDPTDPASASLHMLPIHSENCLIFVKIDSLSEKDAHDAAEMLRAKNDIVRLDIVISNSGIAKHIGVALDTPGKELRDHFDVNTFDEATKAKTSGRFLTYDGASIPW
ncbi:MAG: hypothetical protein Q9201_005978 [Fulgogasparrea decipioides]